MPDSLPYPDEAPPADDEADVGSTSGFDAGSVAPLIAVVGFLGGVFATLAELPPAGVVESAYRSGEALYNKLTAYNDVFRTDLWREARSDARGVTVCDDARAQMGFTSYTSGDGPYAALIDMDGTVLHEWRRPYSTVWDETAAVDAPQPDSHVYMRKAHVLPDGGLLAIYIAAGDTPWGYGMVRLDRDSRVVWKYLENTHHDFDVAPDGSIFALTHSFSSEPLPDYEGLGDPHLDDYLVVLSPEGRELKRISLIHALARSPYGRLLYQVAAYSLADPLHTNAVEFIDAAKAAVFAFGEEGQVLLSFRELGAIAVLDVETETIVWATRGWWVGQHDPDIMPNGDILMFDNVGRFGDGGLSRVVRFDPRTMAIRWQFPGDGAGDLHSILRSAQQPLPNGNTLITESDGGRILEVAPDGDVVWTYVNPVRGGQDDAFVPVVSWAERIDPVSLDPDFLNALHLKGAGGALQTAGGTGLPEPQCGGDGDGPVRPGFTSLHVGRF